MPRAGRSGDCEVVVAGARRALDGEVVRHHRGFAAVYPAVARDLAVSRRARAIFGAIRSRIHAGLQECPGVEQAIDALARIEDALRFAPGEFLLAAHRERFLPARFEFFQLIIEHIYRVRRQV